MPWIIDYPIVLERMHARHFKSLYYNSGAFGFADPTAARTIGWIGPDDPTLTPAAAGLARHVPPPFEQSLVERAVRLWRGGLPGKIWLMPMSHWAYEIDFGPGNWLGQVLLEIGIDPASLSTRTNAAAIEFAYNEHERVAHFLHRLLEMLGQSDFAMAFPDCRLLCLIHHHRQLWWTTDDERIYARIDAIVPVDAGR
jgi:hypothetical protein